MIEYPYGMKLIEQYIPTEGRIAIDCGANVGKWTRPLAAIFNAVIAVEPDPRAYARLVRKRPSNVQVIQAAIGATKDRVAFSVMPQMMHSHLGTHKSAAEHITVDLIPLDHFVDEAGIAFIKLDVEGAEVAAIRGAHKLIEAHRPVFVIEIHNTEDAVRSAMTALGYETHLIERQMACVPK